MCSRKESTSFSDRRDAHARGRRPHISPRHERRRQVEFLVHLCASPERLTWPRCHSRGTTSATCRLFTRGGIITKGHAGRSLGPNYHSIGHDEGDARAHRHRRRTRREKRLLRGRCVIHFGFFTGSPRLAERIDSVVPLLTGHGRDAARLAKQITERGERVPLSLNNGFFDAVPLRRRSANRSRVRSRTSILPILRVF